jgi:putative phosphoesterase
VILGVLSDTHGLLRPEAVEALRGRDALIHAGDVGDRAVLEELRRLAPLTAIRGNVDRGELARELPPTALVEHEGVTIYVLHDLHELDLKPRAAGIRVVISGHTHKPKIEEADGVLYLNPGSAGPRRFHDPTTVAELIVEHGEPRARIIELSMI